MNLLQLCLDNILLFYLLIINFVSIIVFIVDKNNSINNRRRVPEKTLHLLELLGGVFGILLFSKIIRHKSSKKSYYIITYIILIFWLVGAYFFVYLQ